MKTTIPKLRRMIQETLGENYYDQEAEDIRDEHRGYKEEEGEDKIYSPEFGWVTREELSELESQMHETARVKGNTMRITESKLRRIIRDTLKEAYVPSQELDFGDSPGYVDDYEYEEWKIIFPKRASPVEKEWREWYYSLIPNWKDSTNDPVATELRVSYKDRHHRTNPHDAKIRVMAHNSGRFMARMPPQDASGHAEIKLFKRV